MKRTEGEAVFSLKDTRRPVEEVADAALRPGLFGSHRLVAWAVRIAHGLLMPDGPVGRFWGPPFARSEPGRQASSGLGAFLGVLKITISAPVVRACCNVPSRAWIRTCQKTQMNSPPQRPLARVDSQDVRLSPQGGA